MDQAYTRLWKQLLAEKRAFASHALAIELFGREREIIKKWIKGKVLDLGAGDLTYRPLLTEVAERYFSLDIEVTHSELNYIANGEQLPFADGSVDSIFCAEVMEHTPHPLKMTAEMSRVLTKGGHLILLVPFIYYLHGEPHDYHRFSPHALRTYAQEHHFTIVEEGGIGGLVIFNGMLLQNIWLLATYNLPGFKSLSWGLNTLFSRLLIWLYQGF